MLRDDLQVALNDNLGHAPISNYRRELHAILDVASLIQAFEQFISANVHILLVVNEYGETQGILSLEDILESLLGIEIVDEQDTVEDMQVLAKRLATMRRKKMGLAPEPGSDKTDQPPTSID